MFHSARIKLTAWYLLIIMTISLIFSGIIYKGWRDEVDRFERAQRIRIQRRLEDLLLPENRFPAPPVADVELINETKWRLLIFLAALNGGVLFIAGVSSYFLAGKTLRPIQDMVENQTRFVGDASHELRTPLASLRSAFEVYLRDKNKTIKEAETIIKDSVVEVNRLAALTNSLLLSVNLQSIAKTEDQLARVSLSTVISESIKRVQALSDDKKINISYSPKVFFIKGNRPKLIELFTILLDNAIKYGRSGGWIKVTFQKTDHSVLVNIRDNGVGIAAKDLPNIFNRFYRADTSRARTNSSGFGLGLSIGKQIVQEHHGSIGVESQLGKGSNFIVRFPLSK